MFFDKNKFLFIILFIIIISILYYYKIIKKENFDDGNNTRLEYNRNWGCKFFKKTGIDKSQAFCKEGTENGEPGNCNVNGAYGFHIVLKCETSANDWCKACNNFPIPSEYMYEGKLRKVLCSWKYHKWNAGFFINLILESDDLCPLKFGSPTLVSNCKYV